MTMNTALNQCIVKYQLTHTEIFWWRVVSSFAYSTFLVAEWMYFRRMFAYIIRYQRSSFSTHTISVYSTILFIIQGVSRVDDNIKRGGTPDFVHVRYDDCLPIWRFIAAVWKI